mgnify:FL=1
MSHIIADNIISPLGDTSLANYFAVKAGKTALAAHSCTEIGIKEDFVASMLTPQQRTAIAVAGLSHFEAKVVTSVTKAVEATTIDLTDNRVVLILSTTKGNIEQIAAPSGNVHIGESAARIAAHLGMKSTPIVVCNACISGLSAIILADRLLSQGQYDYAVVCGTDDIGRFVVSGFQSLKALSPQQCRPFDMERMGLNLGDAVATMVLAANNASAAGWRVCGGAVRNDAFHISAPSKRAEGQYLCLEHIMQHTAAKDLAFVNLHGTATLFNDQMESVAMERAGLSNVPANSLKGYFGHTLGAAGILETIISIKAADDHTVLATRGFEELGVSGKVNLSANNTSTDKSAFVKTLSGFGGCNAAALVAKGNCSESHTDLQPRQLKATHRVTITPSGVTTNGTSLPTGATPGQLLTWLYKRHVGNYPKYYKMDKLCRLGFIASELLLQAEGAERFVERDDRAVVFFNSLSSLNADKAYFESIAHHDDFFPSPSLFVYTLPNIVTGEIAIRNQLHGETAFYVIPHRDDALMRQVMQATAADATTRSIMGGWLEYADDQNFTADLSIFEIQ